jgi:transcription initiation factor IIE alpha subunit
MEGGKMTKQEMNEMVKKLKTAQDLLSDVYHYACENDFGGLENQMSCADSCISDSLDMLEQVEEQSIDDASWRA